MDEELKEHIQEPITQTPKSKTWLWILIAVVITLIIAAAGAFAFKMIILDKVLLTNADLDGQVKQYEERLKGFDADASVDLLSQVTSKAIVFNEHLYWGSDSYTENVTIYSYDLHPKSTEGVKVIYESEGDSKLSEDEKQRYVSDFSIIEDKLFAFIGGYLVNGGIIAIDDSGAKNIFVGANPNITLVNGKYLMSTGEGDACYSRTTYHLFDVNEFTTQKLLEAYDDCGEGLGLFGFDDNYIYVGVYELKEVMEEGSFDLGYLAKVYKASYDDLETRIYIEESDIPESALR
ncbi:hypothetical protein HN958_01630 [Candidatus Falkowbacteria bacterium]|jgi:hypothetical protein|nr:hypothetical protein [Candidatus Falkowbacteria bacterium]MBT7007185.1 hypothetical protein [Candidatus Falkowbacteria bacterium]